ncbi:MAG: alpha-amylase [Oscillospiraceae bacterium]|nr:alpha-amylase [Oscillospiraceae bacterium]
MAISTSKAYRNQILYSIFVRNYSEEGTFEAIRRDLDRIRSLGTDIIWLMPIHPLGLKARKGSLGSPYAISDYRAVNPEFGTLEDFKRLVEDIHVHGMKCIIDVVYNHTSPDSWLSQNHPEWFYHKADGSFGNRVGDWTDIIDLDYSNQDLWDYQIDTLKMWAEIVDGFRCDVAPLVPLDFWLKAREEVEKVHPGCFWLAESVEPGFIVFNRSRGMTAHSDCELFQAFDCCYDYDIWDIYSDYLACKCPLSEYAAAVTRQEGMYPANYLKLRCLENHDRARAAQVCGSEQMLRNWTAFNYFQKGLTMIYAGQEAAAAHTPSLFDKDTINWNTGKDLTRMLMKLASIKRDPIFADSTYTVTALPRDILLAVHNAKEQKMFGIFSLRGETSLVETDIADGIYENLITGESVEVYAGKMLIQGEPVIIKA